MTDTDEQLWVFYGNDSEGLWVRLRRSIDSTLVKELRQERKNRAEKEPNKRFQNSLSWKPKRFYVLLASFADEDQAAQYGSNLMLMNCEVWRVWHTESRQGAQLLTPPSNLISWTDSCKSILLLLLNTLSWGAEKKRRTDDQIAWKSSLHALHLHVDVHNEPHLGHKPSDKLH